jgi:DNA-binding SARP family transcriptional activator
MEFRILGPLEVVDGGRPVHISGAKERAVLAILLLHANEVVSADRLVDELWGERPPATARKSLQVRVSALRNALGNEMLVTQRSGYLIGLDAEALDLHCFERLVAEARAALAGDRPDVAARCLRTALALWRGPPLLEFAYQPFAQGAIARLEELRFAALELRIDADLACGLHAEAVAELEALVADHPLRERPRGLLMLALYRSGRQADALEVYRRTRQTLLDELGITPSPALQQLEQAILRQEPTLDLATAPTPQRSILVAALSEASVDVLLAVGQPLAARPSRELILAHVLGPADDIGRASAGLDQRRAALIERGIAARPAVFTSPAPAQDIVRLAGEQDVDLLIVEAPASLLDDPVLRAVLETAPCDVGVLVRGEKETSGPVLVPFAGAEHDWSAVELGAWIARAERIPLRLAGPIGKERDASRLLASASLAVQRALGVVAEPQVVAPGPDGLLMAAEHAALVVVGLSDRWRTDGLGTARLALATKGRAPVLLVRRGLRPGGLAPRESLTRYTWSLAVA